MKDSKDFVIQIGYAKSTESIRVRNPTSIAEMIQWCDTHSHIWFVDVSGKARQCKVNGKVRTWKRDPERIEVPVKYGLREYAVFTAADIHRVLIPV